MHLLDPNELRAVEHLRLNPRRTFNGKIRGERLAKRKGISIEFADYREYTDGDDLRHLDWNVLARLQTPVMKTYQDEEDLCVYLLLDCSASMGFGEIPKVEAAAKALAAIGISALSAQDAVYPRVLGRRQAPTPSLRARSSYPKLTSWLAKQTPDGDRSLSQSLHEFAATATRGGVVVIASDGLDENVASALRLVAARGHEVWFVQILSDEELDPDLEGDLRLVDVESGATVEITANSLALDAYRTNLESHCGLIQSECQRLGGRYAMYRSGQPLLSLVKENFKRQGWLIS